MAADRATKTIVSAIGSAEDLRRRADTIEAHYYKELARASLAAVTDPTAAFLCSADRDEAAASELLSSVSGICSAGTSGALFAKYCAQLLSARGKLPTLAEMFPRTGEMGDTLTAAYVTGSSADASFERFRDELSRLYRAQLRRSHAERVQNACDSILDGTADFAVIPIWNNRDGRLRSFYRMIEGFDLKILSVTDTATEDDMTCFALCGADACPLFPSPAHMEFSIRGQNMLITTLTSALVAHGHTAAEIASYPAAKGQTLFHFIINAEGDLRPTLLYLNLFHPGHTILGIYGNRNER